VLISVAVPVPFLDLLTYNVPDSLAVPPIGARVRVPVGARTLTGCVVRHDAPAEDGTDVKDIAEAVDREPLLPASIVELCRWVADYYVAGIGDALAVAMPPGARGKASAFRKQRIAALSIMGSDPESERGAADPHPGARRPADHRA
jgi:primosomal protein N' (replication factor Y)